MFDLEIAGVRSSPMPLQGQPHGSIIHFHVLWRADLRAGHDIQGRAVRSPSLA
jgi:hypothetical protein